MKALGYDYVMKRGKNERKKFDTQSKKAEFNFKIAIRRSKGVGEEKTVSNAKYKDSYTRDEACLRMKI